MRAKFQEKGVSKKFCGVIVIFFALNTFSAGAQSIPGLTTVPSSPPYTPVIAKGILIDYQNPLKMQLIIDTGNAETSLTENELNKEAIKLMRYFLASLTTPDDDLWVNLSPYERDRIIPEGFGKTEMGVELLAQDYFLKQLTASLMSPECSTGKEFWRKVHLLARKSRNIADIPVHAFSKVWIIPAEAEIYEHSKGAFIVNSRLKVLLEEDYLALKQNQLEQKSFSAREFNQEPSAEEINRLSSSILREVLLPVLEKEINEGEGFSLLRQIYNSMILAAWYKKRLKDVPMISSYINKNKGRGIDAADPEAGQKIYARYVEAYKENMERGQIYEDYDENKEQVVPRKYVSGGVRLKTNVDNRRLRAESLQPQGLFKKAEFELKTIRDPSDPASLTLERDFGRTGERFNVLGLGTIWYGRQWPIGNLGYVFPDEKEVYNHLRLALGRMVNAQGMLMVDTAPAYGTAGKNVRSSEEWIGSFLSQNPHLQKRIFIATKVGEEVPGIGESSGQVIHTLDHLKESVDRSLKRLGKIDLLYIHQASLDVLKDLEYMAMLKKMRAEHYGGIKLIGASISNAEVIEQALLQDLFADVDVIQLPARIVVEKSELITALHERNLAVVVNSPIRSLKGENDYEAQYQKLIDDSRISVVLTGSRMHLPETIGYVVNHIISPEEKVVVSEEEIDVRIKEIAMKGKEFEYAVGEDKIDAAIAESRSRRVVSFGGTWVRYADEGGSERWEETRTVILERSEKSIIVSAQSVVEHEGYLDYGTHFERTVSAHPPEVVKIRLGPGQEQTPGGIDFDPNVLNLKTNSDGDKFPQFQNLPGFENNTRFHGLSPVIIHLNSVENILPLLGIQN